MNETELYAAIYIHCKRHWEEKKHRCTDCIFHYNETDGYGCMGRDPTVKLSEDDRIINPHGSIIRA